MTYTGVFENILRVGEIESVDYHAQTCSIRMYDRIEDRTMTCPIPQPVPGSDFGIFIHPQPGMLVLVGWGNRERPFIVSYLPNRAFSQDLTSSNYTENILADSTGYPFLDESEVSIKGRLGTEISFQNEGTIIASFGESKVYMDQSNKFILDTEISTVKTESSLHRSGLVLRDLRNKSTSQEKTENKKTSLSHFRYLSPVARDPNFAPVLVSSGLTQGFVEQIRNPPFVEERRIIKEFADSYNPGTLSEEKERTKEENNFDFLFQPNHRSETSYDVLNLNPENPNNLIESVQGTLVDIYGNLLDINRNIIQFPSDEEGRKNLEKRLPQLYKLTRRSVKLHYEINSRKEADGEVAVDVLDGPDIANGHTHSRWSLDVDAEGLTKINIPASSNIGNIPLLSRYITAHLQNKTKEVDVDPNADRPEKDISHLAFGNLSGDGIGIPETYAPTDLAGTGVIKYRTAFHDIINTASKALEGEPTPGAHGHPALTPSVSVSGNSEFSDAVSAAANSPSPSSPGMPVPGASVPAIQGFLNNSIPLSASDNPNAGGRSLHANLDGSLELNVGRDFVDHKSIVLDTSGGIISRIGRTKEESNNASVISQLDGNVYIQVGGDAVEGEEPLESPKVRLIVKGSAGVDEVVIDQDTVRISSAPGKNIVLESKKNIILSAKGQILLAGATVGIHGATDSKGNITSGPHRLVMQKGKEI